MKILLGVLLTLYIASSVNAQHPIWLDEAIRVDDPGELAYWTAVDTACPLTEVEVKSLVESVLIGDRIEPVTNKLFEDGRIYLNLDLHCARVVPGNKYAFAISIHFGRYKPWPAILFDAPFAEYGIGDKNMIRQTCKGRVKAAVGAFIKANMLFVGER